MLGVKTVSKLERCALLIEISKLKVCDRLYENKRGTNNNISLVFLNNYLKQNRSHLEILLNVLNFNVNRTEMK